MDISLNLILFVAVAAFTPGPNNIMMMSSGLNFGVKASLSHFFGICFGVPTLLLGIGFGLGLIFEQFPLLHLFVKLAGIAYLLYLAWLIASSATLQAGHQEIKPWTFTQAFLFQWVNPKTWLMGSGAIAAYTSAGENVSMQILGVVLVFFLIAFPSAGVWLVFGGKLQRLFGRPSYLRFFNILMAVLLVASILVSALQAFV